MIIRHAMNAKYTHDLEALVAELLSRREFRDLPADMLLERLQPLSAYTYCKDYYWSDAEQYGYATSDRAFYYHKPTLPVVTFWNVEDTARRLIEDHGFACIVCLERTDWIAIGKLYDRDIAEAVHGRQTTLAPPLICRDCARDVPIMISRWASCSAAEATIERIMERVAA